ncbi:hypothetical protein AADG42_08290 [Ammonicoccus fulvus]|uniref:Uncharacterized protein n=1 Tax=Ammonicoccus fulvus TaxID=3138240 RepID=A0ABZ3FR13_9ACTN
MSDDENIHKSVTMQLYAIHAGGNERRKRFLLMEYVCSRCGDIVLQVWGTHPRRAVTTREPDKSPYSLTSFNAHKQVPAELAHRIEDGTLTLREFAEYFFSEEVFEQGEPRAPERAGRRRRLEILPAEGDEDSPRSFSSVCRCQRWDFSLDNVRSDLARKIRKRSVKSPVGQS